ncbi:hypothetical protein SH528x_002217 [Novipirellula sp. SH528]|uniref:hypothetical protein n=1 Tax=Novipirellula sp. SH528 TaxID=3454466 RepID=UPI003FA0C10D
MALRQAGALRPSSEAIAEVDSPAGRQRVSDYLQSRPFPHYEPVSDRPGILRKTDEHGTETIGRFINRVFKSSVQRVSMRASQGGHDVPDGKLETKFARTQANLARAIERLPPVLIFDNSDLSPPYRLTERY